MSQPGNCVIAPKKLKAVISKFAPQFEGFAQHDSQEFLAFLLDGLHEDLNRAIRGNSEMYPEITENDGSDEGLAHVMWERHKKNNNSIVVDIFQGITVYPFLEFFLTSCKGQLKSSLCCQSCGGVSTTFDPFMYLSLPLKEARGSLFEIPLIMAGGIHGETSENVDSRVPKKFVVEVPEGALVRDLKKVSTS